MYIGKNYLKLTILIIIGLSASLFATPTKPTPVTPANGAKGVSVHPTFVWDSTATAVNWQIQIATDSNFTNVVFTSIIGAITDTVYTYAGTLNNGTLYWWHVRASDNINFSPFSDSSKFTTTAF